MYIIGSSAWTYGQPLPRAMAGMASVSLDQEMIILGKNTHYIIIIHSIIGGWGDDSSYQERSEILSYKGGNWTEVGQLGISRMFFAATLIKVDPTLCD